MENQNSQLPGHGINHGFRKKSKTEPAISLAKYRSKKQEEQRQDTIQLPSMKENDISNNANLHRRLLNKVGASAGEVGFVVQAGTIGSIASFSGSQLFSTIVDNSDSVDADIFNNFEFPITNLVFEGGGNKGMSYVGVLQVLYWHNFQQ